MRGSTTCPVEFCVIYVRQPLIKPQMHQGGEEQLSCESPFVKILNYSSAEMSSLFLDSFASLSLKWCSCNQEHQEGVPLSIVSLSNQEILCKLSERRGTNSHFMSDPLCQHHLLFHLHDDEWNAESSSPALEFSIHQEILDSPGI